MSEEKKTQMQTTLALIKPDAFAVSDKIISRILKEGFEICDQKQVVLTKTLAEKFYAEHKNKKFFGELVNMMTSGPIYALKLQCNGAIKKWRTLMGPTKHDDAVKNAPKSLRALYGKDTTRNACHGSDSEESAKRELDFYFNTEQTLALIKPDAVEAKNDGKIIALIEKEEFVILEKQKLTLTKERASLFYAEHKGKKFFQELVDFMTSGPLVALKLSRKNAIKHWRSVMGPTKRETALKEAPNSVRALYGKDTTHNASHGSDSIISASRELDFFFPQEQTLAMIKPDAMAKKYAPKIIERIVKEQFTVIEIQEKKLTKEQAGKFYEEHKERNFYGELVSKMSSGPIMALKLQRTNAIKKWREVMGPTFVEKAKKEAPNSIRALFGSSKTSNATHGSDSTQSAQRELEFHFPNGGGLQRTLGLIKPDALANKKDNEILQRIKYEGFHIVSMKKLKLTKEKAVAFYKEHEGKGFFDELVNFMISGELIALKLEKRGAIKAWRKLIGPTKKEVALKESPNCIRALYGTNTTKNASHGSDSVESANRELKFFF